MPWGVVVISDLRVIKIRHLMALCERHDSERQVDTISTEKDNGTHPCRKDTIIEIAKLMRWWERTEGR